MASVYRRSRKRPIPSNAIIKNGEAKWRNRRGQWQTAKLTPDGEQIVHVDNAWTISYIDHSGKRQTISGGTHRRHADRKAEKIEDRKQLIRDGFVSPEEINAAQAGRESIAKHLDDYTTSLLAKNAGQRHVEDTHRMVTSAVAESNMVTLADINADRLDHFLSKMRDEWPGTFGGAGASVRTRNSYATAMKGFTRWLTERGRLAADPLVSVKNQKGDRRHERRALSFDEWTILRQHLVDAPEQYGMQGAERVLLYEVAIQTGLRAGELRSLTVGACRLAHIRPTVSCRGKITKNAKDAHQNLRSETATALREHVAHKLSAAPVFNMPATTKTSQMFGADVEAARTAWIAAAIDNPGEHREREQSDTLVSIDGEDKRLVFHSLRYTCGVWLVKAGNDPRIVQDIMRHSTIKLTMDTYGHLWENESALAVAKLPDMRPKGTINLMASRLASNQGTQHATTSDGHGLQASELG